VNLSSDVDDSETESDQEESDNNGDSSRVWCPVDGSSRTVPPSHFPFLGKPGLKDDVEHDPLDYLRLFLDDNVIGIIVAETNRYAEQCSSNPSKARSRTNRWEPVTADDIWVFISLIILHGIIGKLLQKWYWSTNRLISSS